MKKVLEKYGFEAYTPSDPNLHVPMLQQSEDPYTRAYNRFDHYQQHVRDCDIYLAVLDDHRGYEVDSDVAFESGMAFMLDGKKDVRIYRDASEHGGEDVLHGRRWRQPRGH